MNDPARVGELLPGVLAEVVDRAGHDYERWAELVAQAGYCHHPIRLAGRVDQADRQTGEVEGVRHPPRISLPVVCGHLPGRRLPAPGGRPARRQGRP